MEIVSQSLNICHVVANINEHSGGPAYSVTNLAQALSEQGISPHLFTLDYQEHGKPVATKNVHIHSYTATKLAKYLRGFQPSASRALHQLAATELDLIHNHGLWMFPNVYARQAAIRNNLPLLISPRGMLEPWSLQNSWYKKLPAWFLYEQQNLQKAIAFHATSKEEAESIRQLNFRQPIAVIPNGVIIPNLDTQPDRKVLVSLFPQLTAKKWLLFLSRIHPKKGLDNLLFVWKTLIKQFPDWHLIIAGPDLIGYQSKLEELTATLQLQPQVTFTGMLSGEQKASALFNADLFILPTHSENFGLAIAESLAYGVPAITTKGTPWQDLETYGCGWWVENSQQALINALKEAMDMPLSKRQAMGIQGRNLVQGKYSWEAIAKDMTSVYHWILGGGESPSCVQLYSP
ncbi:glycosyltransferase [Anabaena sp. UHCC 0399]|uniref:glycosyltransferase n=1 Tax=Anabaena sp. UHCC 0399 TaxID=3110238 RepID=UPI002B1FF54F|nr:glycosyltransferase [Anabaena sp. UHCC 0399]MEA5566128.1 glycosyltransferase [Anabaena sp. UHCC 0399]